MILDRAILSLYNAFLVLISPALLLKKAIKFGRRGHHHEWDMARWKPPAAVEGKGIRVVFVALSWGEVGILDEISRRLEAERPDLNIIWSIREARAQQLAAKAFPTRTIVPMPFDFLVPTRNWVGQVRPDVLVVVEKFWWPNLVWWSKLRGAKIVLVNGRSRGRDKTRYKWLTGLQKWTLRAFDTLIFEGPAQIERVRDVLPCGAKVSATGNVKFSFQAPAPPPHADELSKWLQNKTPLLVAGSTSPIDDQWALEAWQEVKKTHACMLLIAPRSLSRAKDVVALLRAKQISVSLRSEPTPDAEILLLDTMGELAYAYQFSVAAYVGGSVEGRGHNIIEPLAWGIPVSYGSIRGDFESAQLAAEEFQVGTRLRTVGELARFWEKALTDEVWRGDVIGRSAELIKAQRGALDAVVDALKLQVEEVHPAP